MDIPQQSVMDRPAELEALGGATARTRRTRPQGIAWFWLLWEHRKFLWRVTLRGFLVTLMVALLIPPRYQSVTRLMPPDQPGGGMSAMLSAVAGNSSLGGLGGSLGGMTSDLFGLKTSGDLFIGMLHSRTVQDRIIQRFDLRKVYWDKYWETARRDLTKRTDINEDKKSGVIEISVSDRDRYRAQQMAQAYVDELNGLVSEVSTSSARRERIFLDQRLTAVRQQLQDDSVELSKYESHNAVLDLPSQAKSTVEAAARLQGELIAAQSELQAVEQIYTGSNVRVRSLRAKVDELRSQLAKIGGTSAAASPEDDGGAGPNDLYPSIRQLPLLGVRWLDLYRQFKIEETVYELLTQQYELAKVQEAKEIPTVKVLDPADVPERRSFPPYSLVIALGTCFSLSLAVGWLVGTSLWNSGDPQAPARQLALEVWSSCINQVHLFRSHLVRSRGTIGSGA